MVVMMAMQMLIFFHIPHDHTHMGTVNAALLGALRQKTDTGNPQLCQLPHHLIGLVEQLQQGSGQHIAGCAHAAVQIKCFHPLASMWLIMLAR